MNYKIAICDDEKIYLEEISQNIKKRNSDYKINVYNSGAELVKNNPDYDIIFLDIEMPDMDGMTTAERLREMKFDGIIIFLTSHTEFMPDAFKVKAFRFLSKPIDAKKLYEALCAAEKEIMNTEHVIINCNGNSVYMKLTDIVFIEAYGDGTYIYDKNNNVYDTRKPLKFWREQIGDVHFFQIHKSMIVSLLYISNISNDGIITVGCLQKDLPISRRNFAPFKAAFFEYVRKHSRVL